MQWLAEVCVKRPVFATMLILSLVVVGAFSFFSLGVDLFPKIDFPTITVTVVNPGASPQEMETEITEKVEEAVNTISGIDELRSSSIEGISQVFVQFVLEKDVNVAAQEVENRVQTVIPNLPETAEPICIQALGYPAETWEAGGQTPKPPLGEMFYEMEVGKPFASDPKVEEELKATKLIGEPAPLPWRDAELEYLTRALGLDNTLLNEVEP